MDKHVRLTIIFTIGLLLVAGGFGHARMAKAESISNIGTNLDSDTQKKLKELEEKAAKYKKLIDIKQSQQQSLNNQISLMATEIESLENEIELKKGQIEDLDNQVVTLTNRINEQDNSLRSQKKILSELVQAFYESSKESFLGSILGGAKQLAFLSEEDHLNQAGEKIREMMSNVVALKNDLEREKKIVEGKKGEITQLFAELNEKNEALANSKQQKLQLAVQTKGEEKKYKEMLARVEEQKQELLGDIDERFSANSAEIEALKASLPKPSSGLASTSWYYSQKDPRWATTTIGRSNSYMKDYGCAISSVAMVLTYHGEKITPGSLAKKPIYSWDLISWPKEWGTVDLVENTNHGGVDWKKVDRELMLDHPVIVFVSARGRAGHYVVIHHKDSKGKYVVHDPYFGSNIYLESTMKLLGSLYGTSITMSKVDQMILYK